MRKKESFKGLLLGIEVNEMEKLPYFGNFLRWLDAEKGSVRVNLHNYISFLKQQFDVWYKLCRITRKSLAEYIEDSYPAVDFEEEIDDEVCEDEE